MHPLPRQLLIGLVVSLLVLAAAGATWFAARKKDDSLASLLPADAVLAYAEFSPDDLAMPAVLASMAPSLPSFPDSLNPTVTAFAAVRLPNGTTGWVTWRRDADGRPRMEASDPALSALADGTAPRLAADPAFRRLRFADANWAYIAFPSVSPDGSTFERLLALDSPLALRLSASGRTLRVPLGPAPVLAPRAERPLVRLANEAHAVHLPSWNALGALTTILTPEAAAVAEAVGSTFLGDVADGLSLRYDMADLLAGPSVARSGTDVDGKPVHALEGTGRTAAATDAALRLLHERFASARGSSRVRTVTAEGMSQRTISHEREESTVERRDGRWTVLETATDGGRLASAHDGARFAVTTDPDALFTRSDAGGETSPWSVLALDDTVRRRVEPLWPSVPDDAAILRFRFGSGPGYIEWTWSTEQ